MWRHPKYYKELRKRAREQTASWYKELRKRNKSDQAISLRESETSAGERSPGPGLKQQASEDSTVNSTRGRVAEPEASSTKLREPQATSVKP